MVISSAASDVYKRQVQTGIMYITDDLTGMISDIWEAQRNCIIKEQI